MYLTKFHPIILFICTLLATNIFAQDANPLFYNDGEMALNTVTYAVKWNSFTIETYINIRWSPNSTQQYINPSKAYRLSQTKYPTIFSEIIKRVGVQQQQTLLEFARDHSVYKEVLTFLLNNTLIVSQIPDKDLLGTTITLHTTTESLMQGVIMPSLSRALVPRLLYPQTITESYTSIIFAVNQPLYSVADLDSSATPAIMYEPKFLPKVYSEQRHIVVYSPDYYNPSNPNINNNYRAFTYIYEENYSYANTGNNPLLITPIALDSNAGGDIIISSEDTQLLLESIENINLIEEGKVFFIIPTLTIEEILE